jgi:hypothetical protein
VSGWVVLLISFSLPLLIVGGILWTEIHDELRRDILILLTPLSIYTAAVATTCLVRHAVYAAILSVAAAYLGVFVAWIGWLTAGLFGWVDWNPDLWWEPSRTLVQLGLVVSIVVCTLTGWLAVRYDWGWKSRY